MAHKSIDKITVTDLVEKCGVNRNTFYYYYKDIYDLIEDIFKSEIQKVLLNQREYESFEEQLRQGINLILQYKDSIRHIYYSKSRDVVEKYLNAVSDDFVERYVRKQAEGLDIREDNIRFVTVCYSTSLKGSTVKWLQDAGKIEADVFVRKLSDFCESTVRVALLALNEKE